MGKEDGVGGCSLHGCTLLDGEGLLERAVLSQPSHLSLALGGEVACPRRLDAATAGAPKAELAVPPRRRASASTNAPSRSAHLAAHSRHRRRG